VEIDSIESQFNSVADEYDAQRRFSGLNNFTFLVQDYSSVASLTRKIRSTKRSSYNVMLGLKP